MLRSNACIASIIGFMHATMVTDRLTAAMAVPILATEGRSLRVHNPRRPHSWFRCHKLDSQTSARKCEHVIKLLLAIVIALSLLGSPGAARSAPSVSCSMPGADHGQAADHEKMGCCTPDCATPAPSAMLPSGPLGAPPIGPTKIAVWVPSYLELVPTNPAAADPPPRAFLV